MAGVQELGSEHSASPIPAIHLTTECLLSKAACGWCYSEAQSQKSGKPCWSRRVVSLSPISNDSSLWINWVTGIETSAVPITHLYILWRPSSLIGPDSPWQMNQQKSLRPRRHNICWGCSQVNHHSHYLLIVGKPLRGLFSLLSNDTVRWDKGCISL